MVKLIISTSDGWKSCCYFSNQKKACKYVYKRLGKKREKFTREGIKYRQETYINDTSRKDTISSYSGNEWESFYFKTKDQIS